MLFVLLFSEKKKQFSSIYEKIRYLDERDNYCWKKIKENYQC